MRLLGVAKLTAAKGRATRVANDKAEAEGKPRIHGNVGKKLRKQLKLTEPTPKAEPTPAAATTAPAAPHTA
jgi:hypothetical protein